MKRFLIFLLLGPLLGFLVFLLRNVSAGKIVGGFIGFVFGLPFAYLFGRPIVLVMWVEVFPKSVKPSPMVAGASRLSIWTGVASTRFLRRKKMHDMSAFRKPELVAKAATALLALFAPTGAPAPRRGFPPHPTPPDSSHISTLTPEC